MSKTPYDVEPVRRDKDDILIEILNSVRSFDKRLRNVESDKDFKNSQNKQVEGILNKLKFYGGGEIDDHRKDYYNKIFHTYRIKNDDDNLDSSLVET